jgi:hypothetical protein
MTDLFKEVIPSILQTKIPVITVDNERDYVPFVVNRALSFHYDCIMQANAMNLSSNIDKKLQYDYHINSIRSYKRPFKKWHKKDTIQNIEAIKEYFKYSNEKAKDVLNILSDEQLSIIKDKLNKGGLINKK